MMVLCVKSLRTNPPLKKQIKLSDRRWAVSNPHVATVSHCVSFVTWEVQAVSRAEPKQPNAELLGLKRPPWMHSPSSPAQPVVPSALTKCCVGTRRFDAVPRGSGWPPPKARRMLFNCGSVSCLCDDGIFILAAMNYSGAESAASWTGACVCVRIHVR